PPESLYHATHARFRGGWLLASSEDRYSGLPSSRNLRWFDHLAGRRPAALIGIKDDSYALRYELTPIGFAALARPRGAPLPVPDQARQALAVLEQASLDPYFRAYDPESFEQVEKWRFAAFAARSALMFCQPQAGGEIR